MTVFLGVAMAQIISEKLIEDVKGSIKEENKQFLMKLIDDMRAADLADLIEHLDSGERLYVFELLEPEGAGDVLVEMESPVQESIFERLRCICYSRRVSSIERVLASIHIGNISPILHMSSQRSGTMSDTSPMMIRLSLEDARIGLSSRMAH